MELSEVTARGQISKVHTFQLKVGTYSRDVTQPGGGGTLGVTHKCDVRGGAKEGLYIECILGMGGEAVVSHSPGLGGSAHPATYNPLSFFYAAFVCDVYNQS